MFLKVSIYLVKFKKEKQNLLFVVYIFVMLQEVLKESQMPNVTKKNTISVFSTTSLGDIMKDFSEMSVTRVAIGYVAMVS